MIPIDVSSKAKMAVVVERGSLHFVSTHFGIASLNDLLFAYHSSSQGRWLIIDKTRSGVMLA